MRFYQIVGAGLAAVASAGAAQAAHQLIYAPLTRSAAYSNAHQGPQVAGSAMVVENATIITQYVAPGGTSVHAPLSLTSSGASVATPGGFSSLPPFGGSASAGADLSTGILKASVSGYGPNVFGSHVGFADARLADTLYFTNSSGGDLSVTFRYSFDGLITDPNDGNWAYATASLAFGCDFFRCFNESGQAIRFGNTGVAASDSINAYTDQDGIRQFARNIYGDQYQLFDRFDVWQSAPHGAGGAIDGWIQARLTIPTGLTSLGVRGDLNLDCRGGASCNFGNTGTFGFVGGLPEGLSLGSASGVFLSAAPSGGGNPSAVPEPASWALMIAGFGLVGGTIRRSRSARAA